MSTAHIFPERHARNRDTVLLGLTKGPRSGTDLADTFAVRCGTKLDVGYALDRLKAAGLIRGEQQGGRRNSVVWHLTQAGITEALRLIAAKQEARAGA